MFRFPIRAASLSPSTFLQQSARGQSSRAFLGLMVTSAGAWLWEPQAKSEELGTQGNLTMQETGCC